MSGSLKLLRFISVIVTMLLCVGCNNEKKLFQQALSNYESMSPYLIIKIRADAATETIAVQNSDLFYNFRSEFGLDSLAYVESIKHHIKNKKPFEVSKATMMSLQSYYVYRHHRVDSLLSEGVIELLKYYFDDMGYIKKDLTGAELSYMAKVLFEEGILITHADFTDKIVLYPSTDPFEYPEPPYPDTSLVPVLPH